MSTPRRKPMPHNSTMEVAKEHIYQTENIINGLQGVTALI